MNEKTKTSDYQLAVPLTAIFFVNQLSFREAEILFGEPEHVTFEELNMLFNKLWYQLREEHFAESLFEKYDFFGKEMSEFHDIEC